MMLLAETASRAAKAAFVSACLLLDLSAVGRADWPQWRGPARNGSVEGHPRGEDWPERPVLLWEREVGQGYSGPIVARNRIWIHTRRGEQEAVSSPALGDGEELWTRRYGAPFEQDHTALAHGRGPYATPALADKRVITLGITAVLSAWDAEAGTLLWRKDYSDEFDPNHTLFGVAASPLVWEGLCFVHFGGPKEGKLGVPGPGAMVALNVTDGRERWRWIGDSPGLGASPVIQVIRGRPQLVFKARAIIVGADPRTGKELWRIPFKVTEDNTIVTPLFVDEVLVTSDYDKGMYAWRIEGEGDSWKARELWHGREASLFMSSPVVSGDLVIGFSHFKMGQLFGLNPRDGRVVWRGPARWGEHASLIAWGNQVLVFREDGSLVVGEVSQEQFRLLRTYRLGGEKMLGHPAVVDERIIIKDGNRLAVYRLQTSEPMVRE